MNRTGITEKNAFKPVSGTLDWIVSRVIKSIFGMGQKDIEDIVDQIASAVVSKLTQEEKQLFHGISYEGGLLWDGFQNAQMKDILLKKESDLPLLQILLRDFSIKNPSH